MSATASSTPRATHRPSQAPRHRDPTPAPAREGSTPNLTDVQLDPHAPRWASRSDAAFAQQMAIVEARRYQLDVIRGRRKHAMSSTHHCRIDLTNPKRVQDLLHDAAVLCHWENSSVELAYRHTQSELNTQHLWATPLVVARYLQLRERALRNSEAAIHQRVRRVSAQIVPNRAAL